MRILVLAICLAIAAPAHAANDFPTFVSGLAAGKPPAAWLASCQTLVTPDGRVHRPCAIALTHLVSDTKGVTLAIASNKTASYPQSNLEYREAVVEARSGKKVVATFRVLEIAYCCGNPDAPSGPLAIHWAQLVTDKEVTAAAKAGKLAEPPAVATYMQKHGDGDDAMLFDAMTQTVAFGLTTEALASAAEDGTIVLGSTRGERYTGKSGAAAIKGWKLAMTWDGGADTSGGNRIAVSVTHVLTKTTTKPEVVVPYVVLVVVVQAMTGGGGMSTKPALVEFAVAR